MILLHTHAIQLRPGVLGEEPVLLPAETQRGVAATIAALWPNRTDARGSYEYWYWQYNTRTPYEVLEDVPEHLMPRLREFRQALAQDARVSAVLEEN
jgi:hypothetical protein